MDDCTDKIIELEFEIRDVRDKMNIYLDILNNIDNDGNVILSNTTT